MKQDVDTEELKRDFDTLLKNYWYAICTRGSARLPGEQKEDEEWAIELMKKYGI